MIHSRRPQVPLATESTPYPISSINSGSVAAKMPTLVPFILPESPYMFIFTVHTGSFHAKS
jgi:hypothetical protein